MDADNYKRHQSTRSDQPQHDTDRDKPRPHDTLPSVGSIHQASVHSVKYFGLFLSVPTYRRHVLVHHSQAGQGHNPRGSVSTLHLMTTDTILFDTLPKSSLRSFHVKFAAFSLATTTALLHSHHYVIRSSRKLVETCGLPVVILTGS
jgi:hypothetical protein